MAKQALKKIISFKKVENDITVWVDVATSQQEREKVVNISYEILSMYQLDLIIRKKNLSTYIIEGLGMVGYYQNVCDDIFDAYTDWYMHRHTTI